MVVVDVLKCRFGNPGLIIDVYYRSLSHLPATISQTGGLKECFDTIKQHLRGLEAIREDVQP